MNDKVDRQMSSTVEWSIFSVLFGFLIFFAVIGVGWLLWELLAPVFMALLLAFLFRPLIRLMSNWDWPPWLTITTVMVLLVLLIALLMVLLLPIVLEQVSQLRESLPKYIESLISYLPGDNQLDEEIRSKFEESTPENLITIVLKGTAKSFDLFIKAFNNVAYAIIYCLLLLVFFVAFCLFLPNLRLWFCQFLPDSHKDKIYDVSQKIYQSSWVFLRTRLLIALILSIFFSLGWAIAGVPYWLVLGTATGLLNIIPYASALGWLVALLINALEAEGHVSIIFALLWPTVVFAFGQALDGWVLTTWLQGRQLEINPVIVLFSVLAGGLIAGLVGMLLAIPFTAACQIIFTELIKPKLLKWARTH